MVIIRVDTDFYDFTIQKQFDFQYIIFAQQLQKGRYCDLFSFRGIDGFLLKNMQNHSFQKISATSNPKTNPIPPTIQ